MIKQKRVITKLLILLLCTFTFSICFGHNVNASTSISDGKTYQIEANVDPSQEKIMKYDARTQETTEVNTDEISTLSASLGGKSSSTSAYIPSKFSSALNFPTPMSDGWFSKVNNPFEYPYTAVGKVFAGGYTGTGYLVGPNIVLTSAHLIFDDNNNFYNWSFSPAYNNGNYNGKNGGWEQVWYSDNWKTTHAAAYDWAICKMYDNFGDDFGWFGAFCHSTNAEYNNTNVKMVGYPGSYENAKYQYWGDGKIQTTYDGYFYSNIGSVGGFSGSPVYVTDGSYAAVGINHGHTSDGREIGTKITQNMINIIRDLKG